jgi:hypothetical protein
VRLGLIIPAQLTGPAPLWRGFFAEITAEKGHAMTMRMQFWVLIIAMVLVGTALLGSADAEDVAGLESAQEKSDQQVRKMKIRMNIEGKTITATLVDNETSRDFVSLLPLTLTLKDYAATEKISDLPRKLSTKGAPSGYDPSVGDITYYSPWGNLAIFYKDFGYSKGLVKLGSIDGWIEKLGSIKGDFEAVFKLIE